MMMTLRRLGALHDRASRTGANREDLAQLATALVQRRRERGSSKLSRRMRRKVALGQSGTI